jgi:fatty acid desaturase
MTLQKPIDLRALRGQVPDHLFELPLFRTLGKAIFLLTLLGTALALGTMFDSWILKLAIGAVMGPFLFALASSGHESGHCTASRNRFVNDLTGLLAMSTIGIPARGWKLKHDIHHKFGGVQGVDTDTDPGLENYLRLGWFARTFVRHFNRHEFLFWWLIPVSLWITTWKFAFIDLFSRRQRRSTHAFWAVADLALAASFFAAATLYTVYFGWLNLLLLVALPFFLSGWMAATAFVPNHRGMPPLTAEQSRRAARFTHLNSRTVLYPPYLPGNYFMNNVPWQIEHHVFPTMPGFRLKHFSPILRSYAKAEGLPMKYETVFEVMPKMLRRQWLWGHGDGKLYTYAEAEAIRRERVKNGQPLLDKQLKLTAFDNVEGMVRAAASRLPKTAAETAPSR